MGWVFKDVDGSTIVQVKVPVSITIQMENGDAKGMTQEELAGLVDEIIDKIESKVGTVDAEVCPRRWMNRVPVRFAVARSWDELPVDEMDLSYTEDDFFQNRGDEEE